MEMTQGSETEMTLHAFWQSLSAAERQNLISIEKEAILRRVREQQKGVCNCRVCGKKKLVVEKELESIFDFYYQELEKKSPFDGSSLLSSCIKGGADPSVLGVVGEPDSRKFIDLLEQIVEPNLSEEEEEEDEEEDLDKDRGVLYVDEEDYDEEEDEDYDDEEDDDFYDEEEEEGDGYDESFLGRFDHHPYGKEEDRDWDDDGYTDDEEEEEEEEEKGNQRKEAQQLVSPLAKTRIGCQLHGPQVQQQQRKRKGSVSRQEKLAEGRRMFQLFAAKMFEQRVLNAYRERVAHERQRKLLAELEEEQRLAQEREENRLKKLEEKKARKRLAKQLKEQKEREEQERLQREQEELIRAQEEAKQKQREAQRKKERQEEIRREEERKREAQLKEEEKKKEAERKKREEQKRKRQEKAERERLEKERIERELREKTERELKEKQEKALKEKALKEKQEKEKQEKEVKEKQERERLEKEQIQERERQEKERFTRQEQEENERKQRLSVEFERKKKQLEEQHRIQGEKTRRSTGTEQVFGSMGYEPGIGAMLPRDLTQDIGLDVNTMASVPYGGMAGSSMYGASPFMTSLLADSMPPGLSIGSGSSANGLTGNGLTVNGLTGSGLTGSGLQGSGLAGNGLQGNGLQAGGPFQSAPPGLVSAGLMDVTQKPHGMMSFGGMAASAADISTGFSRGLRSMEPSSFMDPAIVESSRINGQSSLPIGQPYFAAPPSLAPLPFSPLQSISASSMDPLQGKFDSAFGKRATGNNNNNNNETTDIWGSQVFPPIAMNKWSLSLS